MPKTIINVEDVRRIREELAVINRLKLEDIEWHENGQPLVIAPEAIEYWRFCGLNNTGFIEFEIYKELNGRKN